MTITHEDKSLETNTYDTAEIQLNLTKCLPVDSVFFTLTNAAITDVTSVNGKIVVEVIYDITDKKTPAMQQGINIVLYSDGTQRKFVNVGRE